MVNEQTRVTIWESLVSADFDSRYWAEVTAREHGRERQLLGVQLLLNSAAIAGVVAGFAWSAAWVQVLAVFAALASTALMIRKFNRSCATSVQLLQGWSSLRSDFESLWLRVPTLTEDAAMAEWERLDAKTAPLIAMAAPAFSVDPVLSNKCFDETLAARHVAVAT